MTVAKRKTVALCASYAPSFVVFRGRLVERLLASDCDVLCIAPSFDADTESWLAARGVRQVGVVVLDTHVWV